MSSMLQHNGVLDIRSKPTFVPRGYYLLFHFCLLVLLLVYLFSCFLVPLLAMSIMLICFMPRSYALCIFSLHCLFAGFLSLHLHVHTWSGTLRARAQSPRRKQKGHGYKHVDVSQAALFNRFRGLAYPIWLCTL